MYLAESASLTPTASIEIGALVIFSVVMVFNAGKTVQLLHSVKDMLGKHDDKLDNHGTRITVVETKVEDLEHRIPPERAAATAPGGHRHGS